MGKLFGFLEYNRELPPDRDPLERRTTGTRSTACFPRRRSGSKRRGA